MIDRRQFITAALVSPIVASVGAVAFAHEWTRIYSVTREDWVSEMTWGDIVEADYEQEGRSTAVFRPVEVLWINKPLVIA